MIIAGDAVDEVSFMYIFYYTYTPVIETLNVQEFPESEGPVIQLIGFPELPTISQD